MNEEEIAHWLIIAVARRHVLEMLGGSSRLTTKSFAGSIVATLDRPFEIFLADNARTGRMYVLLISFLLSSFDLA